MAKLIELESAPSTLSLYRRALLARKSGLLPDGPRELARVMLKRVRAERASVDAYRSVCGFSDGNLLPVTYPFVLSAPLHMELLVCDAFPLPVLGIVHVRNAITQHRAIGQDEVLDIECTLRGPRPAAKGLEFDLHTRIESAGEEVWQCVSTLLRRSQTKERRVRSGERKSAGFTPSTTLDWHIPANTGRRYAAVSGDRNPIHLYALTARLFGFPRAIAHGMWSKARCLAELEPLLPQGPFRVEVSFKLPIYLPNNVQFQYFAAGEGECESADESIEFTVRDSGGKKPHLFGTVEAL